MRALIVEDDPATCSSLTTTLTSAGFVCDAAGLGEEGLDLARRYPYDIVVLDLMLPDMDGREVLRRMRRARVRTPVLILSGLSGVDDRVKALETGADDYLIKPFDGRELLGRIQAVVRRARGHADSALRSGDLVVNLRKRTAEWRSRPLELTAKEYAVLEFLAVRQGSVVSKEMILDRLYGGQDEPDLRTIDVFIHKLRKKLARASGDDGYVETVWGRGYVLRDRPGVERDTHERGEPVAGSSPGVRDPGAPGSERPHVYQLPGGNASS